MLRLLPVVVAAVSSAACASHPPEQAAAPAPKTAPDEQVVGWNGDDPDRCPDVPQENFDGCPEPNPEDAISALALPAAACVLATESWNGEESITELRLSADGPVFALINKPHAKLHLPVGPSSASAALEVEDAGLVVRGFVKSTAFAIHPSKPLVLGRFVIPTPFANLSYTEAREGQVSIGYEIGPGVEVLSPPLGASVSCSDLTVDYASFEATAALGSSSNLKDEQMRLGHAVALRAELGGEVVARLRPQDAEDSVVQVLERSGGSKRILWWRGTAVVFGWVAASEIRPLSVGLSGYGVGHGVPALPRSTAILYVLRCNRDVALFAESGGLRAKVGSVKSGTLIEVLERGPDFYSIQMRSTNIAAAPTARLFASAYVLASCARVR
jgi:hypothetical protein